MSETESSSNTIDMSLGRVTPRRTATDLVSASLRRSILTGELAAGTRLGLTDLASIFDVSTTPVREALRQLSFEGLVTLGDYRGGVVAAVSRSEVEEIVRIRQVLEPLAIEEAVVGMTDAILDDAAAILERMAATDSWDTWVHGNRAFHQKIYEAASSRRLVSLIKGLQDMTVVFVSSTLSRTPLLKDTATHDHQAILRAARDRDASTLIEVTLRHLTIPVRG